MGEQKAWYEGRFKKEIPMTIVHLKEKSQECLRLINKRKDASKKLQEATDLLMRDKVDQASLLKVMEQVRKLNVRLTALDREIFDIMIEVIMIIEAKYANFGFSIKTPNIRTDAGENLKSRRIVFSSWLSALGTPNDDMVYIGPEDTLFFRAVQKAFGADPRTVDFLPSSQFDDFWDDMLQSLREKETEESSENTENTESCESGNSPNEV